MNEWIEGWMKDERKKKKKEGRKKEKNKEEKGKTGQRLHGQ